MVIRVYWASVTSNRKIDGDQARVRDIIESLKLDSKWIDITTNRSVLVEMREACSNPKALPPQIFKDEVYLGSADDMNSSIEEGRLMEWLMTDEANVQPTASNAQYGSNNCSDDSRTDKVTDAVAALAVNGSVNSTEDTARMSPKESRKTVELNFIVNDKESDSDLKIDEARKRRILGLAPVESNQEASSHSDEKKSAEIQTYDGVSKIRSQFEVKNAA